MPIKKNNKTVVSIKRGTTDIIKVYKGSVLKFQKSSGGGLYIEFDIYGRLDGNDDYDILGLYQGKRNSVLTDIFVDGLTPTEYIAAHPSATWYDTSAMTALMVHDNNIHHVKLVYSEETANSYYMQSAWKNLISNLTYTVSASKMTNVE